MDAPPRPGKPGRRGRAPARGPQPRRPRGPGGGQFAPAPGPDPAPAAAMALDDPDRPPGGDPGAADASRLAAAAEPLLGLAAAFAAAGHRLWLVGGAVRDAVDTPGPPKDLDCTTGARPEQIRAVLETEASDVWTVGQQFGTVCGLLNGGHQVEITAHRADTYTPGSRKPVVEFGDSIEGDLARRDFTVNAMAYDPLTGEIADPHDGRGDLAARRLRTPGPPEVSFTDDPLRMLRAARFVSGRGMRPDPELVEAAARAAPTLRTVSMERISAEIERLLSTGDPGPGLGFLSDTGLLAAAVDGIDAADAPTLAAACADAGGAPADKWAALLSGHPDPGRVMRSLRLPGSVIAAARRRLGALEALADPPTDAPGLRRAAAAGFAEPGAVRFARSVMSARGSPVGALDAFENDIAALARREDLTDLKPASTGEDVMRILGTGPGPAVGRVLRRLQDARFERGPLSADDETLIIEQTSQTAAAAPATA